MGQHPKPIYASTETDIHCLAKRRKGEIECQLSIIHNVTKNVISMKI